MPYAQQHYPFENKELFETTFPADFVSEGIDQTRGTSNGGMGYFDSAKPPSRLVLHTFGFIDTFVWQSPLEKPDRHRSRSGGVRRLISASDGLLRIFCSDGKKMSKSLKNYPDPNLVIDQFGADATR